MTGIQYVTDEKGRKVAVQIDLKEHRELWEDLQASVFLLIGGLWQADAAMTTPRVCQGSPWVVRSA